MIKTFTGPMHSGKTKRMMDVYFGIYNKEHILCFKPKKDDRDIGEIRSKDYIEGIPCIGIDKFEDILKYMRKDVKTIFIDEVQMLDGDPNFLADLIYTFELDIDIYMAGLNQTSEQKPFLVMPELLALSDEIEITKASCYDCGREAALTYFEGDKTVAIQVGDEGYVPLCRRCLIERKKEKGLIKKLTFKNTSK